MLDESDSYLRADFSRITRAVIEYIAGTMAFQSSIGKSQSSMKQLTTKKDDLNVTVSTHKQDQSHRSSMRKRTVSLSDGLRIQAAEKLKEDIEKHYLRSAY